MLKKFEKSRLNYYSLIHMAPIPIQILDSNSNVILWNISAEETFGWTESEVIGRRSPIIPDEEKEKFIKMHALILNGKSLTTIEAKRQKKDGTLLDTIINCFPWFDENGGIAGYVAIIKDVTKQKKNERQLEQTFKKLKDFQYALDVATNLSISDRYGKIIYVNDRLCEVSKFTREELIGQSHRILNSGSHKNDYFQDLWETITQGKVWNGELRNRTKDGKIWWANATIVPFLDKDNKPYQYMAIRTDITDQKLLENELQVQKQKVERISYIDYLTGLPNRLLFEEELRRKLEEARINKQMFALMVVNLDGFKFINDTIGHKTGDKLLKEVALRLNQTRTMDDFVARIGGDEFAIIVSNMKEMDAIHQIARNFLEIFDWPFLIDSYEFFITASIGISLYPYGGENVDSLIQNADLALYRAKEIGKNQYEIFSPTMNVGAFKRFSLKNDLRKAVQENEIFTLYQPKVDSKTKRIVGAEALARWKHPEWGVVSPDEFISLAEETGLINMIGEQILMEACTQTKKWQEVGLPLVKMSVNFSALQFLQADIVDTVQNVLHATNLDPKWLEIELTETVVMKNETATLMKLKQLKDLGVSIAIDDFGTGYSSLSYLKKIQPNTVKIDQSFVKDIPGDSENTEIATAVIRLAEKLKMNVVAEGVETSQQVAYLQKIHCHELQGYYFSKPIPTKEFESLLRKGECIPSEGFKKDETSYENRRAYFRIDLPRPLIANMTITALGGKHVKLGTTKVLLEDIGPGGVRFTSNIRLPIRSDLILKISTVILDQEIETMGTIVWCKEEDHLQQYGLQLTISDKARDTLTGLLNQFQAKLRNRIITETCCSFLTTDKEVFFNLKKDQIR
ncbi:EAL domain-containing protein [Schinkia sp. CFF1]